VKTDCLRLFAADSIQIEAGKGHLAMNAREWMQAAGIVMIGMGLLCFPIGFGMSPKRDISAFSNLADLSLF
jgi:hypothetical protein